MKRIVVELEDDLHLAFKAKCASEGRSIKDRVTDLIKQYLEPLTLKNGS